MNYTIDTRYKKSFVIFFIAFVLYTLPILLSNLYYRDDIVRALNSLPEWYYLGRPLADFVTELVTFSKGYLLDTSPLFLVISIVLMPLTFSFFMAKKIGNMNFSYYMIAMCALYNPFYLQNLLYEYDVFPMTLACCCSIFGWCFYEDKKIISVILIVFTLLLYQPLANIYLTLAILDFSYRVYKNHSFLNGIKGFLKQLILLIVAYIVYIIVLKTLGITSNRGTYISLDMKGVFSVTNSIRLAFNRWMSFSIGTPYIYVLLVFYLLSMLEICSSMKEFYNNKGVFNCIARSLIVAITPFVLIISSVGPLMLIEDSSASEPRVVTCLSFIFVYLAYLSINFLMRINTKISLCFSFILPLMLLTFAYSTVATIKEQRTFEDRIYDSLFQDLLKYKADRVIIGGVMPLSPIAKNSVNRNQLTSYILTPALTWIANRQVYSRGISTVDLSWDIDQQYKKLAKEICSHGDDYLLSDNMLYQIYARNNVMVVNLKGRSPMCL